MHVYPTTAPDPTGALCIPGPLHLKTSAHLHAYEVFIHSVQSTGLQQLPRLQQEDDSTLVTKTAKLLQPPPPPPPPPQQQQQQPPLPPPPQGQRANTSSPTLEATRVPRQLQEQGADALLNLYGIPKRQQRRQSKIFAPLMEATRSPLHDTVRALGATPPTSSAAIPNGWVRMTPGVGTGVGVDAALQYYQREETIRVENRLTSQDYQLLNEAMPILGSAQDMQQQQWREEEWLNGASGAGVMGVPGGVPQQLAIPGPEVWTKPIKYISHTAASTAPAGSGASRSVEHQDDSACDSQAATYAMECKDARFRRVQALMDKRKGYSKGLH